MRQWFETNMCIFFSNSLEHSSDLHNLQQITAKPINRLFLLVILRGFFGYFEGFLVIFRGFLAIMCFFPGYWGFSGHFEGVLVILRVFLAILRGFWLF